MKEHTGYFSKIKANFIFPDQNKVNKSGPPHEKVRVEKKEQKNYLYVIFK
ncbi:hypothetical protein [Wolbachia endosymbiont of Pentalonia nigronervosa]|nr:hypothetical protein [Wolbachia endosymbiont of Pentalonia nigronervosa]